MIIPSKVGLKWQKKYKSEQYEQYERFDENMKIKLDLCNYTLKTGLKRATGIDASALQLKANLARLKLN